MDNKYFIIKNFPNDIYNAVGQIIKASQEWEQEYKKLALLLNIPTKKVSNASLNKLNEALKKDGLISYNEYNDLKNVIKIRNYINHDFFLIDFQKEFDSFEQQIEMLENFLNSAQFLIFEATDLIDNKIDVLQGSTFVRPTIFD